MPWIHFHLGSKGQVNACCVSSIKYGNINNSDINTIWNNEKINDTRAKFLNGTADKRCAVCINLELSGAKSIRLETFEKFPDIDITTINNPIYFDIRFSNVCNFRCRTCWHGASSKWFNEAKILKTNLGSKAIIKNINDFNQFIEKNGQFLHQAQEFYFAGGEPLVTEEHYLLLDYLIANNITNVKLRYNTNFSILKFKHYDILSYWKQFKEVEVLASIDESEELGEYVRKELNWDTFVSNREKIRSLSNVSFKISPTISVFNIETLPDFYKKCLSLNLIESNDIYINILDRPHYYSAKVLPQDKKETITNKYIEFISWCHQNNVSKPIQSQFNDCIKFMNEDDYHTKYWPVFISETKQLDEMRNENYTSVTTKQ
jgi:MoaA/NifB/PqqE/SkfB family radical SAM enzyme